MEDEGQERQLNIHLDPENLAGVYSNFANISFSDYEFTLTFARIDHEVEEGDVPGVVVARVNMSTRFMRELLDAMQDSWSKWSSREGIRNLPETPENEALDRYFTEYDHCPFRLSRGQGSAGQDRLVLRCGKAGRCPHGYQRCAV